MIESTKENIDKFVREYNLLFNVPDSKATSAICIQYKDEHPNEFVNSDWSIEKHRKRFMDWMSKQRFEATLSK